LDLMLAALTPAARHALETLMNTGKYEYKSDFARKYYGEGVAAGRANALVQLLEARSIPVSDAQRAEIRACLDVAKLERLFARAVNARTIDEVLANE
jgi:hypothetical protein